MIQKKNSAKASGIEGKPQDTLSGKTAASQVKGASAEAEQQRQQALPPRTSLGAKSGVVLTSSAEPQKRSMFSRQESPISRIPAERAAMPGASDDAQKQQPISLAAGQVGGLTPCEGAELLAILLKFKYFIDELSNAVRSKTIMRTVECEKISTLRNEIALGFKNFNSELSKLQGVLSKATSSVRDVSSEIESLRKSLNELKGAHNKTKQELDRLTGALLVGNANERDKYIAAAESIFAVFETIYQRTLVHKAMELRSELYAYAVDFVKGVRSVDELGSVFEELKTDAKANAYCLDNICGWNQSIDDIHKSFNDAFGNCEDINAMSQKYDKCQFLDVLIIPEIDGEFNPQIMTSRDVAEEDGVSYRVTGIRKIGFKKSTVKKELEKAVVTAEDVQRSK